MNINISNELAVFLLAENQHLTGVIDVAWLDIANENPLYNDIRYNSKIRYNVNLVWTKISGSCIFSLTFPCYSSEKHVLCICNNRLGAAILTNTQNV